MNIDKLIGWIFLESFWRTVDKMGKSGSLFVTFGLVCGDLLSIMSDQTEMPIFLAFIIGGFCFWALMVRLIDKLSL